MKRGTRIRQSEVRVRSGARLISFLLVVCVFAMFFKVLWLAKISGVLALFFTAVTTLEYWNVWRLKRHTHEDPNHE